MDATFIKPVALCRLLALCFLSRELESSLRKLFLPFIEIANLADKVPMRAFSSAVQSRKLLAG
jgi:hypothetical protein